MNSTLREEINKIIDHAKIRKCSKPGCKENTYSVYSATQAILAIIQKKQLEAELKALKWLDDEYQTCSQGLEREDPNYTQICYPAQPVFDRIAELTKDLKEGK